jgi:hypothetical protein
MSRRLNRSCIKINIDIVNMSRRLNRSWIKININIVNMSRRLNRSCTKVNIDIVNMSRRLNISWIKININIVNLSRRLNRSCTKINIDMVNMSRRLNRSWIKININIVNMSRRLNRSRIQRYYNRFTQLCHMWELLLGNARGAGTANPSGTPELPPVFSGVRVTRSLVLYVCFVDRCLSFCTFSFGHCVVYSLMCGFWLPLWYLQTLLAWSHHYMEMRFWSINLLNPVTLYALKCLYKTRKVSGYVYMYAWGIKIRFFNWILELLLKLIIPKYISIIIIIKSKVQIPHS